MEQDRLLLDATGDVLLLDDGGDELLNPGHTASAYPTDLSPSLLVGFAPSNIWHLQILGLV